MGEELEGGEMIESSQETLCINCKQPFHNDDFVHPIFQRDTFESRDGIVISQSGIYYLCQNCFIAKQQLKKQKEKEDAKIT